MIDQNKDGKCDKCGASLRPGEKVCAKCFGRGLPTIQPCPHCGTTEVYRHGSDPDHIVVAHNPGCWEGRLSVMKEGGDDHKQWEKRHNNQPEKDT